MEAIKNIAKKSKDYSIEVKCPICNEEWTEPPRYNQLYRLNRSVSDPGKPPDLNVLYETEKYK